MDQSKDNKEKEFYRREIIKMTEKIENPTLLMKIFIFIKTWLEE